MSVGDQFDMTLDVTVIQVKNARARLQFKTDNGTLVRFWYGLERLEKATTLRDRDSRAPTEARW
jgi:hypothetical protein